VFVVPLLSDVNDDDVVILLVVACFYCPAMLNIIFGELAIK